MEEAIEKALKKLNISREKIKIKVLEEGEKGLFGMPGEKKAKIQVIIPENT